jgi:hypothetical protein
MSEPSKLNYEQRQEVNRLLELIQDDPEKVLFELIAATAKLRELLQSIVADVEEMKCEMPKWYEALDDASKEHWFGGFAEGTYHPDPNEYPFYYIQWPNLDILLEQAKQIVH